MSLVPLAYASLAKPGQPQRITDQDGCTLLYSQCGNRTWTVITMAIFLSFIIVAISQLLSISQVLFWQRVWFSTKGPGVKAVLTVKMNDISSEVDEVWEKISEI